jgi:hypothetical protein
MDEIRFALDAHEFAAVLLLRSANSARETL